jgi:hypothetical protein
MLALHCLKPIRPHEELVNAAKNFFMQQGQVPRGLGYLPAPWLAGLSGVLKRLATNQGRRLFKFEEFYVNEGFLLFRLEGESPNGFGELDLWSVRNALTADNLRVHLQHVLYPSWMRPLKVSHAKLLRQDVPF